MDRALADTVLLALPVGIPGRALGLEFKRLNYAHTLAYIGGANPLNVTLKNGQCR